MLCSKLLVAHVTHPNNLAYFPLLILPSVLTFGAYVAYNLF